MLNQIYSSMYKTLKYFSQILQLFIYCRMSTIGFGCKHKNTGKRARNRHDVQEQNNWSNCPSWVFFFFAMKFIKKKELIVKK